jgi:hypothetical protein
MSTKTKNIKTNPEKLAEFTQQLGLLLMTAAFTIGMVEMPEHGAGQKVIVPNQPSFAFAQNENEGGAPNGDNTMRREREEAGPHYVSYNLSQRTPGRTGKA